MKKKLIPFLMALLCFGTTVTAQTNCNGYTLNTDWRNYVAPSGVIPVAPLQTVNNFDWSANFFTIYEDVGGTVTPKQLQSPFWENTSGLANEPNIDHFRNKFFNNGFYANPTQAIESVDIWPEDGWELLYKDFGDATSAYTDNPSFSLYNRYTGILRLFYYVENLGSTASKTARISITPEGSLKNNALLSFTETELNALDAFERHLSHTLNYAQALENFWIFVEIPIAFDPCVCVYPTEAKMEFTFEIIEQGTITLEGNASGFSTPTIYNNGVYTPQKSNIISSQKKKKGASDYLKEANGFYKTVNSFKSNINTLIGFQKYKGDDEAKAQAEIDKFGNWITIAKAIPKLGAAIGIIDFLITGGKAKNAATREPTPVGYETELNIKLTGTITEPINLSTLSLRTPGATDVGSPNPIYNNPLGVFNLLETPPIEYAEYSSTNLSRTMFKYSALPSSARDVSISSTNPFFDNIKLREYQLVPSSVYNRLVNFIINPRSQLSAKQIKAAILFKFSNLPDDIDTSNYIRRFVGPVEFGITIPDRAGLGFVHRMSMLGYEIESWPKGTARLKDITFRTNYVDLACLENEANFYCWVKNHSNGEIVSETLPETWLKLDIQMQRTDDYAQNNADDVQDVMMILKYAANETVQNTSIPNLKYTVNKYVDLFFPVTLNNPNPPTPVELGYEILPQGEFQPTSISWSYHAQFPWNGAWGIIPQHSLTQGPWSSPVNKKYGTLIVNNSNKYLFVPPFTPRTMNVYNLYIQPGTNFTTHNIINVGNQVFGLSNWSTINTNVNWQQNVNLVYIGGTGPPVPFFGSTFSPIAGNATDIGNLLSFLDLNDPNNIYDINNMLPFIPNFTTNISPDGSVLLTTTGSGSLYIHGYKNCTNPVQNFQATQSDVSSFCNGAAYATAAATKSEDFSGDKNTTPAEELVKEALNVYPNPNTGVFVSAFNINGTKNVSLTISDLSGKIINKIIDNKTYTTGYYKHNIVLDNIAAGMYICTVSIGDNVLREKIIVIK